jgi:selenocysteine lyase/cysteine desulfurase
VSFIEDYIRERVLPLYANTHTEASATGRCMTALREDARG